MGSVFLYPGLIPFSCKTRSFRGRKGGHSVICTSVCTYKVGAKGIAVSAIVKLLNCSDFCTHLIHDLSRKSRGQRGRNASSSPGSATAFCVASCKSLNFPGLSFLVCQIPKALPDRRSGISGDREYYCSGGCACVWNENRTRVGGLAC